ncbi:cell division protein FtsW [Pseudonocardia dioxanivorans CB1190]|uniref:Probable peptidoglycan glycosyltransferase FtsW n=1 Tax=Pseudonocardia dioxanivorans (strain ATCC 55486 / DSM 44775 / JCM 13855 / CB1190) TaxID=675635 RepID=F4CLY8_PSEUX|nr:cell division protein FtsW [Pseudonocardia dioxanivorans CB1190]
MPASLSEVSGAKLWIRLGPLSIQPGEFAKLLIIVFTAAFLVAKRDLFRTAGRRFLGAELPRLRDLAPLVAAWALSLRILAIERELGASLPIFGVVLALIYTATSRVSWVHPVPRIGHSLTVASPRAKGKLVRRGTETSPRRRLTHSGSGGFPARFPSISPMRRILRSFLPAPLRTASSRGRERVLSWLGRPLASFTLIVGLFLLLTVLGLVMVLSASSVEALLHTGSSYSVFYRQLMFCAAGLVMFVVGMRVEPAWLRRASPVLLLLGLLLLAGVLIPGVGTAIAGARKWYSIAGLSFQPSEPAKIALALWGANILTRFHRPAWKDLLSPLLPAAALMLTLVVLEPDLGTAVSLAILVIALLYYAEAPRRALVMIGGGIVGGGLVLGLTAGYRHSRIVSFLSPDTADPLGAAYQSTQALYSLSDGGWFGQGLGQGAAKWSYLPNASNDFIFAILGEELGTVGGMVVIGLFALLAHVGLRIAARNRDRWVRVVVATLTTWLVGQAAINIGYVVGLLPVTGIPLPLISSGGTSLVVTMFAFGVLAGAACREPEAYAVLRQGMAPRLSRLTGIGPRRPPPPGATATAPATRATEQTGP